jgi:hypothetical protein
MILERIATRFDLKSSGSKGRIPDRPILSIWPRKADGPETPGDSFSFRARGSSRSAIAARLAPEFDDGGPDKTAQFRFVRDDEAFISDRLAHHLRHDFEYPICLAAGAAP